MAPETQHRRRRRLPGVCACVCVSPLAKMLEKASTRKKKTPDLLNSDAPRPEGRVSFAGSVSCTLDELAGGDGLHFPAPVRPVTAKGQEVKHVRGPPPPPPLVSVQTLHFIKRDEPNTSAAALHRLVLQQQTATGG